VFIVYLPQRKEYSAVPTELHAIAFSVTGRLIIQLFSSYTGGLVTRQVSISLTLLNCCGIPGQFDKSIVRTLARGSPAEIPMATPNEPGMPFKRTTKVRLGI